MVGPPCRPAAPRCVPLADSGGGDRLRPGRFEGARCHCGVCCPSRAGRSLGGNHRRWSAGRPQPQNWHRSGAVPPRMAVQPGTAGLPRGTLDGALPRHASCPGGGSPSRESTILRGVNGKQFRRNHPRQPRHRRANESAIRGRVEAGGDRGCLQYRQFRLPQE